MYFDPGFGDHVVVDGMIVERNALHLVEKIKDIDPNLEVLCVNPDMEDSPFEEPFIIAERVGDQLFKVFGFWELNDSVLERIHLADTKRFDISAQITATNERVKAEQQRRYQEKREATKDLVAAIARNRTSSYSHRREEDGAIITHYEDRMPTIKGGV